MSFESTVCLVTGAGSGIGRALTLKLLAEGARVAACGRSHYRLEELQRDAGEHARNLVIGQVDVSSEEEVAAFLEKVRLTLGVVRVVVANAGFGIFRPLIEFRTEEFDAVMNTNVRGVFLTLRHTIPGMIEAGGGDVVLVSSLAGKNGFAGGTAYAASKFAVRGLAQSLMLEVRERNVRVITVFPGSTDTRFFDDTSMSPNRAAILSSENVADTILDALRMERRALLSEIDIRPANPKG